MKIPLNRLNEVESAAGGESRRIPRSGSPQGQLREQGQKVLAS